MKNTAEYNVPAFVDIALAISGVSFSKSLILTHCGSIISAVEVYGVIDRGGSIERVSDSEAEFWSVYVREKNGYPLPSECVADVKSKRVAISIAKIIIEAWALEEYEEDYPELLISE